MAVTINIDDEDNITVEKVKKGWKVSVTLSPEMENAIFPDEKSAMEYANLVLTYATNAGFSDENVYALANAGFELDDYPEVSIWKLENEEMEISIYCGQHIIAGEVIAPGINPDEYYVNIDEDEPQAKRLSFPTENLAVKFVTDLAGQGK